MELGIFGFRNLDEKILRLEVASDCNLRESRV